MSDSQRRPDFGSGRPGPNPAGGPVKRRSWIFLALIAFLFAMLFTTFSDRGTEVIDYSDLKNRIREDQVSRVVISSNRIDAEPLPEFAEEGVSTWRAIRVPDDETLVPLLEEKGLDVAAREESACGSGVFWLWLLPLLFILFFWGALFRRMGGGPGAQALTFGKSRAKLYAEEGTGKKFSDVAGCEEVLEELEEVVEFLQEPERFYRLGGRIPKGVLLVGPPGTGKTLLARALAGEANVPFFNISGSDFVEMFVGVGAARVRDLFEQAQKTAPCIIFIDELDAVGKSRGMAGQMSGNDEREQTLNALLVEMDGFSDKQSVIILAATNRPEILDPALLRPGRFDRQILVDRPDIRGREAILRIHTRKLVMDPTVNLQLIAAQTPGFVGADLANVVNEAALLAARRRKQQVEQDEFQDAIERVIAGLEKKNRRLNEREKRIVAYHESGHAIASAALPFTDPVHKVSIIPRGIGALGYTLQVPLEDRYLMTRNELLDKIGALLGGRAAENVVFGDVSTGAQNDLQKVTDIARAMVTEYGMSEAIGSIHLGNTGQPSLLGNVPWNKRDYSDDTAVSIDQEIREIVDCIQKKVLLILETNRDVLEAMASRLLESETVEGNELDDLLNRVAMLDQDIKRAEARRNDQRLDNDGCDPKIDPKQSLI